MSIPTCSSEKSQLIGTEFLEGSKHNFFASKQHQIALMKHLAAFESLSWLTGCDALRISASDAQLASYMSTLSCRGPASLPVPKVRPLQLKLCTVDRRSCQRS